MRVTVIPIIVGALGTVPKGLEKGQEQFENRDQLEYSEEFWRSEDNAVTQTQVKAHRLTLVWKSSQEGK